MGVDLYFCYYQIHNHYTMVWRTAVLNYANFVALHLN